MQERGIQTESCRPTEFRRPRPELRRPKEVKLVWPSPIKTGSFTGNELKKFAKKPLSVLIFKYYITDNISVQLEQQNQQHRKFCIILHMHLYIYTTYMQI